MQVHQQTKHASLSQHAKPQPQLFSACQWLHTMPSRQTLLQGTMPCSMQARNTHQVAPNIARLVVQPEQRAQVLAEAARRAIPAAITNSAAAQVHETQRGLRWVCCRRRPRGMQCKVRSTGVVCDAAGTNVGDDQLTSTAAHGGSKATACSTQQHLALVMSGLGNWSAAGQGINRSIGHNCHAPAKDVGILIVLRHQLTRQHRPSPLPCGAAARRAARSRSHSGIVSGGAWGGGAGSGGLQGGRCWLAGLATCRGGAPSAQGGHRARRRSCGQAGQRLVFCLGLREG